MRTLWRSFDRGEDSRPPSPASRWEASPPVKPFLPIEQTSRAAIPITLDVDGRNAILIVVRLISSSSLSSQPRKIRKLHYYVNPFRESGSHVPKPPPRRAPAPSSTTPPPLGVCAQSPRTYLRNYSNLCIGSW